MPTKAVSYQTEVADAYGVIASLVFHQICFWCATAKGKKDHKKDGKVWIYKSQKDLSNELPISIKQAKTALKKLVDNKYLEKDKFSNGIYNNTTWYTIGIIGKKIAPSFVKRDGFYCVKGPAQTVHAPSAKRATPLVPKGPRYIQKNTKQKGQTESLRAPAVPPDQISELMYVFAPIRTVNYGNKTERKASEDMIKEHGFPECVNMANAAVLGTLNDDQFCPTIVSVYELSQKWAKLRKYINKKQKEVTSKGYVSSADLLKKYL